MTPKRSRSELPTSGREPTHEEIALRAYHIHIEHGATHGCDVQDWLQAERELREELAETNSGQ